MTEATPGPAFFQCPDCHRKSHNPNDIRAGYCGACHRFTGEPDPSLPDPGDDPDRAGDQLGTGTFAALADAAMKLGDTNQIALIAMTGHPDEMLSTTFHVGLSTAIMQDRIIIILRAGRNVIVPKHLVRIAAEIIDWNPDPIAYADTVMDAIRRHLPAGEPQPEDEAVAQPTEL